MIHGRKSDAVGVVVGLVVFAASALVASRGVALGESAAFRAINGLPNVLYWGIWPFMQFGGLVTIPILIVCVPDSGNPVRGRAQGAAT